MRLRLRRVLPKLVATTALAGAIVLVLILTRPLEDEDAHFAHGHHVGELRAEGIRMQQRGDLAGALAKFREAVQMAEKHRLKPALAANRIAIGTVHLTEERYDEAEKELLLALAAAREIGNRTELATALAYLGQTRRLQGRTDEAMAVLREALDVIGDTAARPRALAYFQVGEIYRGQGNMAAALSEYQKAQDVLRAMEDGPGQAAILISIGRTQAALHDTAAAARTLRDARDRLQQLGQATRAKEIDREIAALPAGTRGR
jgi:tetratricopeptide (TPR) repeat protein